MVIREWYFDKDDAIGEAMVEWKGKSLSDKQIPGKITTGGGSERKKNAIGYLVTLAYQYG